MAGFLCFFSVLFVSGPRRQSGGAGESASAACVFVRGRAWSWSVRFRTLVSRWSALRLVLWFCGSVGGSVVACRGCPHGSPGCVRSSLVPSGCGILLRHAWVLEGADLGWLAGLARVGRLAAAGERLVGSVGPWWAFFGCRTWRAAGDSRGRPRRFSTLCAAAIIPIIMIPQLGLRLRWTLSGRHPQVDSGPKNCCRA